MEKLYQQYKSTSEWFLVYIREAHPADGRQVGANVEAGIEIDQPETMEERLAVARTCYSGLGFSFPAIVDGMDDNVEKDYAAWPDRLYVVENGRIVYKGAKGPRGFKPMEMIEALDTLTKVNSAGKLTVTWGALRASP